MRPRYPRTFQLERWFNPADESFMITRLSDEDSSGSLPALTTTWRVSTREPPPQVGDSSTFSEVSQKNIDRFADAAARLYRKNIDELVVETSPDDLEGLFDKHLGPECEMPWDELPKGGYNGRISSENLARDSENQLDRGRAALYAMVKLGIVPGSMTHDVITGASSSRPGLDTTILRALESDIQAIFLSTLDRLRRHRHGALTLDECYAVTGNVFFEPMGETEFIEYLPGDRASARRSILDLTHAYVENLDSTDKKQRGLRSKMQRTLTTHHAFRNRLFFVGERDA